MFYLKIETMDDQTIEIPFDEDNVYVKCFKCGKEIRVEPNWLAEIIQEHGTSEYRISHTDCSLEKTEAEEQPKNAAEVLAVSIAEMIDKKFQPLKEEVAELKRRAQQLGSEN